MDSPPAVAGGKPAERLRGTRPYCGRANEMALLPDLGIAAAIALVVFFLLLGLLVIFVEDLDLKIVLGLLFMLLGLTIGLVAVGEAGISLVAMAVLAAVVLDQMLEHFTGA